MAVVSEDLEVNRNSAMILHEMEIKKSCHPRLIKYCVVPKEHNAYILFDHELGELIEGIRAQ